MAFTNPRGITMVVALLMKRRLANQRQRFTDANRSILCERSPGMTQVYKIKSGGLKRKQMLIDTLKKWKVKLPDL